MNLFQKIGGLFTLTEKKCEKVEYDVAVQGVTYTPSPHIQDIMRWAAEGDGTSDQIVFCVEDKENKRTENATNYYQGFGWFAEMPRIMETQRISSKEADKLFHTGKVIVLPLWPKNTIF